MPSCADCGGKVWWAFDENGKAVGMDTKPDPDGEFTLDSAGVVVRETDLVARDRAGKRGRGFFRAHVCRGER